MLPKGSHVSLYVSGIAAIALMGCSSANLAGSAPKKVQASNTQASSASPPAASSGGKSAAPAGADQAATANPTVDAATSSAAGLDAQAAGPAEQHEVDSSTTGCALPSDVAAKLSEQEGQAGLDLWGGAPGDSGAIELHNLDWHKCDWAAQVQSSKTIEYVVVYLDAAADQSYAEPFGLNDPTMAANFGLCLAATAAVNQGLGGDATAALGQGHQGAAADSTQAPSTSIQCVKLQRDGSGKVTNL